MKLQGTEFINERDEAPSLDRKVIAISLRRLGIDVDFEDWDGLDDSYVRGRVATLAAQYGFDIEAVLTNVAPVEEGGEQYEV